MLRLEQVSKLYRKRQEEIAALQSTNLEIPDGDYVAIIGPSGSGKTTLLSLLGGMLAPTAGKMWIDDESVYDLPIVDRARLRQKKIGFVFQTFNLVPYLTARENVSDRIVRLERGVEDHGGKLIEPGDSGVASCGIAELRNARRFGPSRRAKTARWRDPAD